MSQYAEKAERPALLGATPATTGAHDDPFG
jgi:hypothetical protein